MNTKIKNIVVMDRQYYDETKSNGKLAPLLNNESVKVIPIPVRPKEVKSDELVSKLNSLGLLDNKQILLQDMYDNSSYVSVDNFEQEMQYKKYMYFSLLCQLLGACELKINGINQKIDKKTTSVQAAVEIQNKHVENEVTWDGYSNFTAELNLYDKFEGNSTNIDEAQELLKKTGLIKDTQMTAILEARSVKSNILTERNLKINLSTNIESRLSIVTELGIDNILKIKSKVNKTINSNKALILNITVKFNTEQN